MKLEDARSLDPKAQERLRKQAVKLCQQGLKQSAVAEQLGVARGTVSKWWSQYRSGGIKAIRSRARGKPSGSGRRLSSEQESSIRKAIADKAPDQLKLDFALWTRQAVAEFIEREFSVKLPIRTVGDYLRRWGFTPQKPLKKAYEQNPAAVKRWLSQEYPRIKAKAASQGAEIHWADETGLRSDSQAGRGYAPKGRTPTAALNAKRASASMISSVTNQGKVRFMIYRGAMNSRILIRFLKRLISSAGKKVFVILDNLRSHHSAPVRKWLQANGDKIEAFYLPAYSPELNPDEYLNCDLKSEAHRRPPARSQGMLEKKLLSCMRRLQKMPKRVMKYFEHPKIQYAK